MKNILLLVVLLPLVSCETQENRIKQYDSDNNITNIIKMNNGYIAYNIISENVRCLEHTARPELTCWKEH